jgi:uncharacterized membrane protein
MRRAHRDIAGGGEIAMMAVITKAMGAFLVIMILLLPYYNSGPVSQRTAEQAIESVDQAREQLREAQAALKKGRLTDEEIDEFLKKLEAALHQLEEALLYIQHLKIQVDQLTAQVKRLDSEVEAQRREIVVQRQEIAELKREIERLKEEIERLKRNQGPRQYFWNAVKLDWSECWGARLNLYGVSDMADEKGNLNPPANRTAQGPSFAHDRIYSDTTRWLSDAGARTPMAGYIAWVVDRLRTDEVITFYVKYLNALPDGPNQCTLTARWDNWPGSDGKIQNAVTAKLGERDPYVVLVRLKVGERGALFPQPITEEQRQDFRKQIAASACEGTSCGPDDPQAKPQFVEAIVERFIGKLVLNYVANERLLGGALTERERGEAVLRALGAQYAEKKIGYAEIDKWTTLLQRSSGTRTDGFTDTVRETFVARLRDAKAPDGVIELFRHKFNSGYFNLRGATAAFRALGLPTEMTPNRPEDREAATRLVERWRRQGVDGMTGALVGRMISEGRVQVPVAEELVLLIEKYRYSKKEDHSKTPAGEELQRLLESRVARGAVRDALNPAATSVPPEQSVPVVRQIKPF